MSKHRHKFAVAALTAALAGVTHAGTVQVERTYSNNVLAPGLSGAAYMHWDTGSSTHNGKQTAGPFALTIDGVDYDTFCVDLDHTMSIPKNGGRAYNVLNGLTDMGFSSGNALLAESLFELHLATAATKQSGTSSTQEKAEGAAFQVVLWELLIDDGFDLTGGDFNLDMGRNHGFTNSVFSIASNWYGTLNLNGFQSNTLDLVVIDTPSSQGQVYMTQTPGGGTSVPTPAAAGLGAVGLASLATRRRR